MTPPVSALPGHIENEGATADALVAAVEALPDWRRAEVLRELARAMAHYDATDDPRPVLHFADSLLMTARLSRNEAYRMKVAEAESQDQRRGNEPPPSVDGAEFIQHMRRKYGN